MRWLPIVLPLGLAVAAGIYLAVSMLMHRAGINLTHLDGHDPDCICDDCLLYHDGIG